MVEQLTKSYLKFAELHDEATVRDTYDGLPESLHIHLQRIFNAPLLPENLPYFDRERLLGTSEYFSFLIEQDRVDEIVQHVEGLLKDGNSNGAEWIVRKLADAGQTVAFEGLRGQVKQAFSNKESSGPRDQGGVWKYREFLDISAHSAYNAGQRDLSYDTFMKLDRNHMSPSPVSQVAHKARASGDIEFLRRMESSPSPLMREAALEALAVHYVLNGDIDAAEIKAETFDREFGKNRQSWPTYRTITDRRSIKDPTLRLAATGLALQKLPFDSTHYAVIAREQAKLLDQLYPDTPLPAEWLEKLGNDSKLKYEIELAHAFGL